MNSSDLERLKAMMISKSIRKKRAIATACTAGVILSSHFLFSFRTFAAQPPNTLICPFSGTEAIFQILLPSSEQANTEQANLEQTNADQANTEATVDVNTTDLETSIDILYERIQDVTIEEIAMVPRDANQLLVQLPDSIHSEVQDVIIQLLSQNGQLTFREQREDISLEQLNGLVGERAGLLAQSSSPDQQAVLQQTNEAIATFFHQPSLTGDRVHNASSQPFQGTGIWEISLEFDEQGAEQFAQITQDLAGTRRALGIFWNDDLLAAPTVAAPYASTGITGGRASISGAFTAREARAIALQLRHGTLPFDIELSSTQEISRDSTCAVMQDLPTTSDSKNLLSQPIEAIKQNI